MKNLTKYGMMLLAAALCVGMSSCSDDDDNEGGTGGSSSFASNNPLISEGKKLLTRIECQEDGSPDTYTIIYDEHNRPVQVKNNYGYTSVNYTDGTLYDENGESGKATFTREGYIKSVSSNWSNSYSLTFSCTYDSERHLTKYDYKQSGEEELEIWRMTYVWKNGNLVQSTAYDKYVENDIDDEEWYDVTVEYFDKENKYRQLSAGFIDAIEIDDDAAYAGLFGIGPEKLPKKVVWDDGETYTFEYILNADGSIRQETVTYNDDYDGYNYTGTSTYKYSYKPIE